MGAGQSGPPADQVPSEARNRLKQALANEKALAPDAPVRRYPISDGFVPVRIADLEALLAETEP